MASVKLNAGGQCVRFLFIVWNIVVLVSPLCVWQLASQLIQTRRSGIICWPAVKLGVGDCGVARMAFTAALVTMEVASHSTDRLDSGNFCGAMHAIYGHSRSDHFQLLTAETSNALCGAQWTAAGPKPRQGCLTMHAISVRPEQLLRDVRSCSALCFSVV